MYKPYAVLCTFLLVLSCASAVSAKEPSLQVVTYNAPPHSIVIDGQKMGYTTELIKEALSSLPYRFSIHSYPKLRAISKAKRSSNVLIYPLLRHPNIENDYYWIEKIAPSKSYLFTLKSRTDIPPSPLKRLTNYNIGTITGNNIIDKLKDNKMNNISQTSNGIENILKLSKERIDLLAIDELMLNHLIELYNQRHYERKLNINMFKKISVIPSDDSELYIAMSKNTSVKIVASVKKAISTVHNSGKLIEVAHFWTNKHEQPQVDAYRLPFNQLGFKWIDYTYDGGGGGNFSLVIETRQKQEQLPHAIKTYVGPQIKAWAKEGILLPLNDVAKKQNWDKVLPQSIRNSISYEGNYYAAPTNLQRVNWMWINEKVFKQAGLKPPQNWREFFHALERLHELGITPVALGQYQWQEGTLFESMVLGLGGGDFYRQLFIDFEPEAYRSKTMHNILADLRRVISYTGNERENLTWVKATEKVIRGEAGIYFMGDWVKTIFEHHDFPYGENGYLCLPVPNTEKIFLSNVDAFAFPDSGSRYHEGQKALASIITDKKVQEEFNLVKSSIPARLDVPLDKFDQCSHISADVAQHYDTVPSFNFLQTQPKERQEAVLNIISEFINSDQNVDKTIESLYKTVNKLKD